MIEEFYFKAFSETGCERLFASENQKYIVHIFLKFFLAIG